MSGGLKRLIGAIRTIEIQRPTMVLVNGDLAGPTSNRQSQLKVEAIAEVFQKAKFVAINPGINDARIGLSAFVAIQQLSQNKLLLSDFSINSLNALNQRDFFGMKILGLRAELNRTRSLITTTTNVAGKPNILQSQVILFDGDQAAATKLAQQNPHLNLIVFKSETANSLPLKIGKVWLVSPGSQGKKFVEIRLKNKRFTGYSVIDLGPDVKEDRQASIVYQDYLMRVTSEKLLEKMPRNETDPYAGSRACMPCHTDSYKIWAGSKHGNALATLEEDKHDRDPDCISCHVTGLESTTGFMNRAKTPDLANVGCESCHGPSKKHVIDPMNVKTPKASKEACMTCHNPNHSPKFDFESYWDKIRH